MTRFLCLLGIHSWLAMKWGGSSHLDCRECRRCGRFQIWAFLEYVDGDPALFPDRHEVPA